MRGNPVRLIARKKRTQELCVYARCAVNPVRLIARKRATLVGGHDAR